MKDLIILDDLVVNINEIQSLTRKFIERNYYGVEGWVDEYKYYLCLKDKAPIEIDKIEYYKIIDKLQELKGVDKEC